MASYRTILAIFSIAVLIASLDGASASRLTSMVANKRRMPSSSPMAFSQVSIKSHSRAKANARVRATVEEMLSQRLRAQIQQHVMDGLSELVTDEVMRSEELDFKKNAKGILSKLVNEIVAKASGAVHGTCEKISNIAEDKMNKLSGKLEEIAGEDDEEEEYEDANGGFSELQKSEINRHVEQAFTELSNVLNEHGIWDKIKSTVKKGWKSFKGIVSGFAEAAKPLLAKTAAEFMPSISKKVNEVLGKACDYVGEQIEKRRLPIEDAGPSEESAEEM